MYPQLKKVLFFLYFCNFLPTQVLANDKICHVETLQEISSNHKIVKFLSAGREQLIVFHRHEGWDDGFEIEHFADNFDKKEYQPLGLKIFKEEGLSPSKDMAAVERILTMQAILAQHDHSPFTYAFIEQPSREVNRSIQEFGRLHQALDWLPRNSTRITQNQLLNAYLGLMNE